MTARARQQKMIRRILRQGRDLFLGGDGAGGDVAGSASGAWKAEAGSGVVVSAGGDGGEGAAVTGVGQGVDEASGAGVAGRATVGPDTGASTSGGLTAGTGAAGGD